MVSRQEIAMVLRKMKGIKHTQKPNIDRKMLWCVANLVFFAGVKRNEIAWLKIRDVFRGNNIADRIRQCGRKLIKPIQLSNKVIRILSGYIQHLGQNGARVLDPDSALFDDYSGKSGERNLSRHLEDYKTSFNNLRKAGINYYYQDLLRNGNDSNTAIKGTAKRFRMEERSVRNLVIKGTPNPAGQKKEEKQGLSERVMHFIAEAQKLTDHGILVEDKAHKLLTGFYDLVDSKPNLSKDATWWKDFFVRHMIECVHSNRVISGRMKTVSVEKIPKGLPKDEEVAALRNTLLAYIEKIKGTLSQQEKLALVNQKRAYDELYERRKTGEKESAKNREHRIYPKPSKEKMREMLNQLRKAAKEEEKLRTKKGVHRLSAESLKKSLKRREWRRLHPSVPRTYGVIEKVDEKRNSIIVLVDKRTKAEEFRIEETFPIICNKKEIPFSELKVGMRISFVKSISSKLRWIAAAIRVIPAKEGRKKVLNLRNPQ